MAINHSEAIQNRNLKRIDDKESNKLLSPAKFYGFFEQTN